MNIKHIYRKAIIVPLCALMMGSCTLFDLPLQEEYPYEHTSKNPNINMNAFQFVDSRKTIDMARMYEAITLTGLVSEYEAPDRTFIILNDVAMNAYMKDRNITDLPSSNLETLKNYLKSNIIKGKFTSLDLTTVPTEMDILFKNDTTRLFMNRIPVSLSTANKYELHVNNFPGSSKILKVRTSNILPTNGVIHVVDIYPQYKLAPIQ